MQGLLFLKISEYAKSKKHQNFPGLINKFAHKKK